MNIFLKLEDEVKVFCYGYIKKLFLFLWNVFILRVEINIELLVFYLLVNLVLDSENNYSKFWFMFKFLLYLLFGLVGFCLFLYLMISL